MGRAVRTNVDGLANGGERERVGVVEEQQDDSLVQRQLQVLGALHVRPGAGKRGGGEAK